MTQDASAEVFNDLNAPELQQYAITDRIEVQALLGHMAAKGARASVYFSEPPGFILSTVLAVSPREGTFLFGCDIDPQRNSAAAGSSALAWRSSLEGITVEFMTVRPQRASHLGQPAFRTRVPEVILRLQRRNALRAEAPLVPPLYALLDESGDGTQEKQAQVIDLSALGMCVLVDGRTLPLVAGMRILRARLQLPGFGEVQCGLEIRYILSAGPRQPDYMRRCGARFVEIAAGAESLVAQYINALERDRAKLKATPLGSLSR